MLRNAPENTKIIYKIVSQSQWESAQRAGVFSGAEVDLQDGFIHFSAAHQVAETLEKHFANRDDLFLLGVDTRPLGSELKWETSRGGQLFPHLYAELDLKWVCTCHKIELDQNGRHRLPELADGDDG